MSDPIKLGIIGCGGQGGYLSEAATISGRAELVACADIDAERAAQFAEQFGYAASFGNAAEMLDEADIEAVMVATPHDALCENASDAAEAGKHVLVEKPMAQTPRGAHYLVNAARENDVRLMCGYTLRFLPERREMRRLLDEGAVGEVTHVTSGQLIGPLSGWLDEFGRGGGPLNYVGSHALDFLMWMAGEPVKEVYAQVNSPYGSRAETDVSVTIHFEGGSWGNCSPPSVWAGATAGAT